MLCIILYIFRKTENKAASSIMRARDSILYPLNYESMIVYGEESLVQLDDPAVEYVSNL